MFESILLGLGWMLFFFIVVYFVPPMIVGAFQFWMNFFQNIKIARRQRKEQNRGTQS